jgi:hypothetical protein
MTKIKNILGALLFVFASSLILRAMNWVTDDKGRMAILNGIIRAGAEAQKTKDGWKTITKN